MRSFLNHILRSLFLGAILGILATAATDARAADLVDAPAVWYDQDDANIEEPEERDPNLIWDSVEDGFILPLFRFVDFTRWARRIGSGFGGDHVTAAHNVNELDEVPNSSWFTNRIGIFPMSPEAAAQGPGLGNGPDRSDVWTIISAKTEGVTPGFNVRDAKGDIYLLKFDPKGFLGSTTTAGVISGRIFHAAGYNVPEDETLTFRREQLQLGEGVNLKLPDGSKRTMTDQDIDEILDSVDRLPNGEWFAISSKFLDGKPVGPFNYIGKRKDDSNDRISHENRRELRGLQVIAAWLNHYDTKQHNSLDMFVTEGDRSYVKHHLIDFASTLGAGASGPVQRYGWEYTFDVPATLGQILSLGFYESNWRTVHRPEGLGEVGFWVSEPWDPKEFKSLQPNSAFVNRTGRDLYWAAKIITAFRDEHIDAIVDEAGYRNPEAAEFVGRVLKERRDKIGRTYFDEIPPLDFFRVEENSLVFSDLGRDRNIYPTSIPNYQVRVAAAKASRQTATWSTWSPTKMPLVPLDAAEVQLAEEADSSEYPFIAFDLKVQRHGKWSSSVRVFMARKSHRIVSIER